MALTFDLGRHLLKPKLLLLDEHTAALDPKTKRYGNEPSDKIVKKNNLTNSCDNSNMEITQ